jgi:hypothetical protein
MLRWATYLQQWQVMFLLLDLLLRLLQRDRIN